MQFNHGIKHETLIVKGVFGEFKRGVDWRKFKNEKRKKKWTWYNYNTKGHFARKCHKNKQDWENKFKGFSQIIIISKIELLVIVQFARMHGLLILQLYNI